ncbi:MAG: hypothetical protein ACYS9X_05760 [Planctomycetota bacterium]
MKARIVTLLLAGLAVATAAAGEGQVAFLLPGAKGEQLGPESRAALELARTKHGAVTIAADGRGGFAGEDGRAVSLEGFRAVWYHQGDSAEQKGPVWAQPTVKALRAFAEGGGGLYLSGAAFSMVHKLGIERARPRIGRPGNDRNRAAMAPTQTKHPVFSGLTFSGKTVGMSDRGYPAYSDFHGSGGPASGMLLAKAGGGSENPLVEYAVGKGRAIAMGWRLPHYSNATNAHRANLERVTANILGYLAEPKSWRKVVVGGGRAAHREGGGKGGLRARAARRPAPEGHLRPALPAGGRVPRAARAARGRAQGALGSRGGGREGEARETHGQLREAPARSAPR